MPLDSTDFDVLTEQDARDLDVLRVVRHSVDDGGWIQGTFIDYKTGGRCLVGWVDAATRTGIALGYCVYGDAGRITVQHLAPLISPRRGEDDLVDRVVRFNDLKKTRRSDVMNVLDQAILKLERKGGINAI